MRIDELSRYCITFLLVLITAFGATNVLADNKKNTPKKPPQSDLRLWDIGVGAGLASFSPYRGAKGSSTFGTPFVYATYRGKNVFFGGGGATLKLLNTRRVRVSISASGSLPVDANDVEVRSGMPDLDTIFELGPSLDIDLWQNKNASLKFHFPVRAAFATDFRGIDSVGWITQPSISWFSQRPALGDILKTNLSFGPLFASRKNHAYFYDVAPQFVRPGRPEFRSSGGYSGSRLGLSAWISPRNQSRRWRYGAYVSADLLNDARFIKSPLIEQKQSWLAGLFVSYRITESSQPARSSNNELLTP